MNELFVTMNVYTVATALVGGLILGLVLKDLAKTMLEAFLSNGHINLLLRIAPLFIVVFGTAIDTAFFSSAILTDFMAQTGNNLFRAAGRGLCNLFFVWAVAFGFWLRVRKLLV